jgi:Heparinase II/III-like protein/Heparinase II/III N-terminus
MRAHPPVRRAGRVGIGSAIAVALAAVVVSAAVPSFAGAASKHDVRALQKAPCPSYDVIRSTDDWTADERAAALQGDFPVDFTNFRGFHTHLAPQVNWRKDPLHSQLWRSLLNSMRWLDVLFFDFRETGDPTALREARDLALDWAAADRSPRRAVGTHAWDPKTAGERAAVIGYAMRESACNGLLTDGQAKRLLDSLARHAKKLSKPAPHSDTNHGLYGDLGLALMADYEPFVHKAKRWRRIGMRRFERTLGARLQAREGVWLEPSAAYQVFVAETLAVFVADANPPARYAGLLERMRDAASWFVMPDGQMSQIGDTDLSLPVPAWALARVADESGLRTFRRSGFAFVRDSGGYLAVSASHFVDTHKQADDLSFQLFDRGHRLISDGGKFEGDAGRVRDFSRSSPAHSVLTVDGKERRRRIYKSAIQATGEGGGWYAILGDDPALREQGVRHQRLFLYRPGAALIVVDRIRSAKKHTYRRYFQLGSDLAVIHRGADELGLMASGFDGELFDAKDGSSRAARSTVRGHSHPLLGYTFPDFRRRVARWTVTYTSRARNADHVATFGLDGRPLRATLDPGPLARVTVRAGDEPFESLTVKRNGAHLGVDVSSP